jgi:hypothetical protein
MAKTKISEYSSTANSNTDIASINIDEGCAPSGINNAIRALMAQLKDFQTGAASDPVTVGGVLTVTGGSASAPAITTSGDTNTGVYFPAADTVGITTGGTERVRVDASGKINKGSATWYAAAGITPETQLNGTGIQASIGLNAWQAGTNVQARLYFNRADSSTQGDFTDVVDSGDNLGSIHWTGSDGTAFIEAASINAAVDGTPSTNDMPGRLVFSTTADGASSPIERMRIDSAGNVGIGTSSPTGKLQVKAANPQIWMEDSAGGTNGKFTAIGTSNGAMTFNRYLDNGTLAGEWMRVDSSGNLLVGGTSYFGAGLSLGSPASSGCASIFAAGGTGNHFRFGNVNNGIVGSISTSTSATTYSTSSDYRLKENIAPMTGALSVVQQLKPCTYTWKSDGAAGQGFIAHELAEVVPDCVTGEKDAVETYVDEDGNEQTRPVYQGIDTSFLVATLTAAIQEQQAMIASQSELIIQLQADVAALKGQ